MNVIAKYRKSDGKFSYTTPSIGEVHATLVNLLHCGRSSTFRCNGLRFPSNRRRLLFLINVKAKSETITNRLIGIRHAGNTIYSRDHAMNPLRKGCRLLE